MNESEIANTQSNLSPATQSTSPPDSRKFNWWRWFWLMTLVVSLPYAWYSFYVPSNQVSWSRDFASAQQQASQSGKPMILFFTSDWCVPCRIMRRTVWADEQVAKVVNSRFVCLAVDINDPGQAEVIKQYKIGGAPVTIITDPQSNVLQWRQGGISSVEFLALLGSVP